MKTALWSLPALVLAGCATFSEDGGFGVVESAVRERTGQQARWVRSDDDAKSVRARVKELLAPPLGAEAAAQIALLNNPGLQARYAELGIAEADLVQASRWSGPTFSFARLRHGGGGGADYEASVFLDVLGLITIPLATRAEAKRFEAAKTRAAGEALQLALETRKAWFAAVAAQESAHYMAQVMEAAEASATLAARMAAVGNWSRLNQAREQAFYADAAAQLARARHTRLAAREHLTRLMGLWGEDAAFRLPDRLPELPKAAREAGDLEAQALAQRLDVQAARRDAESLAESLGLTKATRFIDLLEVGHLREREADESRHSGWGVELRIPIFDFGGARSARAEHLYRQSVNRAVESAIQARSEVREAYSAYRTAFDLAKHYRDEIVPLRKKISEEVLLRYNGMLMSVFELLADSREQIAAVNAYLESLRGFWIAESDLQAAMTARSPGAMGGAVRAATAPARSGGAEH
ncbi:MAG: RND transporter [Betaproteobacteria bacterium RIFCSPLOWO2_02_67_12]|nr:MAG: RND transporter [Betaproteobacteria bacterium RIFCSPLOWO2_02_67_12]